MPIATSISITGPLDISKNRLLQANDFLEDPSAKKHECTFYL